MKKQASSPNQGRDDKRASRRQQMEDMEAAARGTAPSMTLDTMELDPMQERNQHVAGNFLLDQEAQTTSRSGGINRTTSAAVASGGTSTGSFFDQHERYAVDQSVNLMDASTKDYSSDFASKKSKRASLVDIFIGSGDSSSRKAKRTSFVDIFVGGSGDTSGAGDPKSRGNVTTTWRTSLPGRLAIGFVLLGFIALLALSVPYLMIDDPSSSQDNASSSEVVVVVEEDVSSSNTESSNSQVEKPDKESAETLSLQPDEAEIDRERFQSLQGMLVDNKVTSEDRLEKQSSSASRALRWLSDEDPAKLSPDDPALVPRFALATLFYAAHPSVAHASNTARQINEEDESGATATDVALGWAHEDSWMTKTSVCDWYGVDCDEDDASTVVHVNMTANGLEGTIPVELASLSSLIRLDLSSNRLSGTIPKELCMSQMKSLLLHKNYLSGSIPDEVENMKDVVEMHLSFNRLEGEIPAFIGSLGSVRALAFENNKLEGSIPDLSGLTKINHLHIGDNALDGELPLSISKLTMLHSLRLENNKLVGTLHPEMMNMKHLQLLYLGSNMLEGSIPDMFDDMNQLTDLQLHGNKLKSTLPETMGHLSSLRRLTLEGNVMTGTLPASFGGMTDLEALELYHNDLQGPIPSEFGKMTNLRNLGLYHNFLQGDLPSELGNLSLLKTLEVQHNAIRGKVPTELGRLESLVTLDLSQNIVTGSVPSEICSLTEDHDLKEASADCRDEIVCDCCTTCI